MRYLLGCRSQTSKSKEIRADLEKEPRDLKPQMPMAVSRVRLCTLGDKYFLRSLFTLGTHQENPQEVGDPGLTMRDVGDRTGLHALGARGWGGSGEWGDLALGPLNPQGVKPVSKDSRATQYFICFDHQLELPFGLFDKNSCR